jgi:xanthine dehydrogenase accessory factor
MYNFRMMFTRENSPIILIRGGGDLASGVALRLHHAGFRVLITELPDPLVVRRLASFAQAVFDGSYCLEGVTCRLVSDAQQATAAFPAEGIPLMIDPEMKVKAELDIYAVVDCRMLKAKTVSEMDAARLVIGLGPGFTAGENCHAVIETNRGPFLGRVFWHGSAEPDTGVPEQVKGFDVQRVLRAPADGVLHAQVEIGAQLEGDDLIAVVGGCDLRAPFKGVLRGLIHDGLMVKKGMKIGDLDPRCDNRLCVIASEKALAIGGCVLEAIMSSLMGDRHN